MTMNQLHGRAAGTPQQIAEIGRAIRFGVRIGMAFLLGRHGYSPSFDMMCANTRSVLHEEGSLCQMLMATAIF